ncbi:hypothetical protein D5F01_LYC23793 [Larimichthys crocea]|uniref:Uncharacterized protein n=1 Tax=Larimichthys crocea TaxID=215358 RepID=A0A6G0HG22_LARCR|nr:hypothetical protein D5F01_LYC23793 [Larimichthys crocea]
MMKVREKGITMWESVQLIGRCTRFPRVKIQREGLFRLGKLLMMLTMLLMVPVMMMLTMDKGENSRTSNFNMPQKHQGMAQVRVKHQRRDLTPVQENLEIKVDKEAPGQFEGELNHSAMQTKIVENASQLTTKAPDVGSTLPKIEETVVRAKLGETTILPCRCGRRTGDADFRSKSGHIVVERRWS